MTISKENHFTISKENHFTISKEDYENFKRLDHYLSAQLSELSRSQIKDMFENKKISSPQTTLELKKMPSVGTEILISLPEKKNSYPLPENIPLDILYEDEHLIIIHKQAGLVVHPGAGNDRGTLVNALLHYSPQIESVGEKLRPGIVHRLDKGTSGVMVIAKTKTSYSKLVQMFSDHDLKRKYLAIAVTKELPVGGTLKSSIGRDPNHRIKMKANVKDGKMAITHYRKISSQKCLHYVECRLETGRTHQIRVHLSQILKAPILADPLYAKPADQINRLRKDFPEITEDLKSSNFPYLHAYSLGFKHPITDKYLEFESSPDQSFLSILKRTKLKPDKS